MYVETKNILCMSDVTVVAIIDSYCIGLST